MGQTTSSCVAGTMGWQEPYMPAKIISDMVGVDEYQLNNAVPMERQNINRRLTSLLSLKCGCLDSNSSEAGGHSVSCQRDCQSKRTSFITKSDSFQYARDYTWKKSLHKESYCKDINFNSTQNDNSKEVAESFKLLTLRSADETQSASREIERNIPVRDSSRKATPLQASKHFSQAHVSPSSQFRNQRSKSPSFVNPDVEKTNLNSSLVHDTGSTQSLLYSRAPLSELLKLYCHNCQIPQNTAPVSPTVANCKEVLILLTNHADNIATNFAAAMKATNNEGWRSIHENTKMIHCTIQTLVKDYCVKGSLKHYASLSWQKVMSSSDDLIAMLNSGTTCKEDLKTQITTLGQELHNVMESLVLYELLVIVEEIIEETNNRYHAVATLIELAEISDFMCCLIVKAGGIQAMTNLLLQNQPNSVYLVTLRALTILCNVQPALCHLRKIGIQHILCMLHCKYGSNVLREATALMARLTDKNNTPVTSQMVENSDNIILLLKDIISRTEDDRVFLLATVVIANLSAIDAITRSLVKHSVLEVLISACTEKTVAQLTATKEQVVTILAIAACSDSGNSIVSKSTIHLLLSFIQLQPLLKHGHHERAMCRRTQEKSAALLSLFCDQKTINMLISDKGLFQLLSICQGKECSNSKVLLFCSLVLQKIASSYKDRHNLCLESRKLAKPTSEQCSYLSQQESFV